MNLSRSTIRKYILGGLLGGMITTFLSSPAAAQFATSNMTLASQIPLGQMGGGSGADIWGWTDSTTNREYAIMTRTNGTAFVDVTDPFNPTYLGNLPSPTGSDTWRDVKTYGDYAYIVADGNGVGPHGMQIFDLTNLRGVTSPQNIFGSKGHSFPQRSQHRHQRGFGLRLRRGHQSQWWPSPGLQPGKQSCRSAVCWSDQCRWLYPRCSGGDVPWSGH